MTTLELTLGSNSTPPIPLELSGVAPTVSLDPVGTMFRGPKGDKGDKGETGAPGNEAGIRISTDPNNRSTKGTDGGLYTPDISVDPLAYYILAKA